MHTKYTGYEQYIIVVSTYKSSQYTAHAVAIQDPEDHWYAVYTTLV